MLFCDLSQTFLMKISFSHFLCKFAVEIRLNIIYMETTDERLKALSELHEDWDDEGALPICPLVLQHTKSLIDAANDMDLAHWNLFPAINGTLTFLHENKDAMLSIGEDDFSFVFASEGRIVKAIDNAPFSIAEILELIKMVNIN